MTPRLSDTWGQLERAGQAPESEGRTAEETRRNQERQRPIRPSERRRRQRRISLTVQAELVDALRAICKEHGHIGDDGQGQIASAVIQELLWLAVGAYRDHLIEHYQEQTVATVDRMRWKA